jgi:hypothetical protein
MHALRFLLIFHDSSEIHRLVSKLERGHRSAMSVACSKKGEINGRTGSTRPNPGNIKIETSTVSAEAGLQVSHLWGTTRERYAILDRSSRPAI